jgi:citrate synthase
MIRTHMDNVAVGGLSMYANSLLAVRPGLPAADLARETAGFMAAERRHSGGCRSAFEISYGLLLGRSPSAVECRILEQMGTIQTHHGSAGSNMVARYLATLHAGSVSDFFTAAQMTMDGARHFGAIHDMTAFQLRLAPLAPEARDQEIRHAVLGGGLPTFGHPEITAAGRTGEVEADPRPAIYVTPLFAALDSGELDLSPRQRERLGILQRIYQIAFVEGVVKREGQEPLRLTPNTDFGAWSVQEALGIRDPDRTFLTYIFRGFGWMMDAREQLLQKIIRPVIAPDPRIVPKASDDLAIPDLVGRFHDRLAANEPAFEPR